MLKSKGWVGRTASQKARVAPLPIPDSRFPIPVPLLGGVRGGFRFPIPDSRFPIPCSLEKCTSPN
ncbi:hypothetical protein [Moorena sp. SIO3B2]|uniref:hypothetical protein n=1 Tax=Moorena sp. SIO3B2 TaxID=2607827 RepID=UPI0013CA5FAB|nr:hypothetical protein [Moorena sp. SIO3B2]NEP32864.1 hypothetical protein [Moorena sp. SIO3B2]